MTMSNHDRTESEPARDAALDARIDALARATVPMPSAAAWERTWQRIDARQSATDARRPAAPAYSGRLPHLMRFWQPLAAAAACALMIGSWILLRGGSDAVPRDAFGVNQIVSMSSPVGDAIPWKVADDDWAIVLVSN